MRIQNLLSFGSVYVSKSQMGNQLNGNLITHIIYMSIDRLQTCMYTYTYQQCFMKVLANECH